MADGAKGLQVIQRALSSPTVNRLDVVDLPEIAFNGSPDHLVQLQKKKTKNGEKKPVSIKVPSEIFIILHSTAKKNKTCNCSRALSYINVPSFPRQAAQAQSSLVIC